MSFLEAETNFEYVIGKIALFHIVLGTAAIRRRRQLLRHEVDTSRYDLD